MPFSLLPPPISQMAADQFYLKQAYFESPNTVLNCSRRQRSQNNFGKGKVEEGRDELVSIAQSIVQWTRSVESVYRN
jgi:hypothetical protein